VRGTAEGSLYVFKGIPYAKPPVGTLRWKAPQPPDPWTGERHATAFGPHCAQTGLTIAGFTGSEDCLTLNIWAPVRSTTALLPVFVYLHEGGNLVGSGDIDFSRFAQAGPVVVVSLNYRLGPFGFLGHPGLASEDAHHSTGNYGILDQLAALQWVQRNIQSFGGDPARVTVGGYSAGAHDTAVLVTSPLARGLFAAAIVMSHSWMVQPAAVVANTAQVAVRYLHCDTAVDVVACLRGTSAPELRQYRLPLQSGVGRRLCAAQDPTADGARRQPQQGPDADRFHHERVDHDLLPARPEHRFRFRLPGHASFAVFQCRSRHGARALPIQQLHTRVLQRAGNGLYRRHG
jgi:para-nitrobenzyl esterase